MLSALIEKIRNPELYKLNRKTRKQLKRLAKKFNCWDYEYLLNFLKSIFESWEEYYSNPDFLHCAESAGYPSRAKMSSELKEAVEKVIKEGDIDSLNEFTKLFTEYLLVLWD